MKKILTGNLRENTLTQGLGDCGELQLDGLHRTKDGQLEIARVKRLGHGLVTVDQQFHIDEDIACDRRVAIEVQADRGIARGENGVKVVNLDFGTVGTFGQTLR